MAWAGSAQPPTSCPALFTGDHFLCLFLCSLFTQKASSSCSLSISQLSPRRNPASQPHSSLLSPCKAHRAVCAQQVLDCYADPAITLLCVYIELQIPLLAECALYPSCKCISQNIARDILISRRPNGNLKMCVSDRHRVDKWLVYLILFSIILLMLIVLFTCMTFHHLFSPVIVILLF